MLSAKRIISGNAARLSAAGRAVGGGRWSHDYVFQEGDTALLQKRKHRPENHETPLHTTPLKSGGHIGTARGRILHDDIIGQTPRSIVKDVKDRSVHNEWRVLRPTLGEYTKETPRKVTPLYPGDANLITSLLDINPSPPKETDDLSQPCEIFEAGTGHGALTLHLARAMQAFNPAPPPLPASLYASTIDGEANQPPAKDEEQDKLASNFAAYKPTRRAVLHTLDISQDYQTHARKIVRGFRQGLYAHNVDFHVGTIPTYLESRLEAQPQTTSSSGKLEPEPFLQHTILDLPDCHKMLSIVSQCLKPNGLVLVFCPSITQVVACVREVKALGLPLLLEDTREIGELAGVGGKSWDVRIMRARSFERKEAAAEVKSAEELLGFELGPLAKDGDAEVVEIEREKREEITEENGYNAIARPKSPGRFMAAAFVGVFRRLEW